MPRPANSATSLKVLENAAAPSPPKQASPEMGEAGSKDALAKLNEAIKELRALAVAPMLQRAVQALQREDFLEGGKWAIKALEQDETSGAGWYLLGIARERAGDWPSSVQAYEAALKLLPNQAEVANDLGRLAWRMGMLEQAEKLFRHFIAHAPEEPTGFNNLATVVRDQGRRDEAIEILKDALGATPDSSLLWNTLGSIMVDTGDLENAFIFLSESLRLDPKFGKARYNLSQVKLGLGDAEGALADCLSALKRKAAADEKEMMRLACSNYRVAMGDLVQGWEDYEARLSPQYADYTRFAFEQPRWKPGDSFGDKTFLVVAEQGLGDEVLFAGLLPDVIRRMGPNGKLKVCVEPRLVSLFQRSFPEAEVSGHATYVWGGRPLRAAPNTELEAVDLWTPMGSLLREFRRSLDAFPDHKGYLTPDPKRVAHWKKLLKTAPAGPKVGLLWKSATTRDHRSRYFSPFEAWEPVLRTPGVTFVNLQYGDCSEEIAQAKRDFGVEIWDPPGIDLKKDLDDLGALSAALDLVLGFANATFNIASACGAPSWLISTPGSWPRLGTDRYPWYPQTRVFLPEKLGAWGSVMEPMAEELAAWGKAKEQ